jgi:uncharacterized membrane protein YedE/YeeE
MRVKPASFGLEGMAIVGWALSRENGPSPAFADDPLALVIRFAGLVGALVRLLVDVALVGWLAGWLGLVAAAMVPGTSWYLGCPGMDQSDRLLTV